MPKITFTISELSKDSGIAEYTIRQWLLQGKIPYVMAGNRYLVTWTNFEAFLQGTSVQEPEKPKTRIRKVQEGSKHGIL